MDTNYAKGNTYYSQAGGPFELMQGSLGSPLPSTVNIRKATNGFVLNVSSYGVASPEFVVDALRDVLFVLEDVFGEDTACHTCAEAGEPFTQDTDSPDDAVIFVKRGSAVRVVAE